MFIYDSDAAKEFGVELITSPEMTRALEIWENITSGTPEWVSEDIKTVNMANFISERTAALVCLDVGISVSGSARADYLQGLSDKMLEKLRSKVARTCRLGGIMIKPNGNGWDFISPGNFGITAKDDNGDITGAIFASHTVQDGKNYTRLEYHRFEGGDENGPVYVITNKCYKNQATFEGRPVLGQQVPLETVDIWSHIKDEVRISKLQKPLFAYFRMPGDNTIDVSSPLGTPIFSEGIEELKSFDIGISRKDDEVEDSQHITFVGQTLVQNIERNGGKLPRFVKGMGMGLRDNETSAIHEHTATLLTEERLKDLNFTLSLLGTKCGFSEGSFIIDGQRGVVTATQVESDDRDTIQTIKDIRDSLSTALEQALYAADMMATLYKIVPMGTYEVTFNFGDITYNYEEDRQNWINYTKLGWSPKYLYFVKFEGMSEKEAKKMIDEAKSENEEPELFPKKE